MRVHAMDATLAEVLKVLAKTLHLERAVVHLAAGSHLHPSAAIRIHDHGKDPEVYDPGEVQEGVSKARITITDAVYTVVHVRFGDTTQIVKDDLGPSVFLWVDGKIRYRAP